MNERANERQTCAKLLFLYSPAPSYIAVAASLASALVGVGLSIMLSSICVATTLGFPCLLHSSMMVFCNIGTSSGAHSTPRSPLATTVRVVVVVVAGDRCGGGRAGGRRDATRYC